MRCASCAAENPDQEKTCSQCGVRLPRASRRREVQPFHNSWASTRLDDRAYRLAVWGLIPPAGLILGPVAVALGFLAVRRARAAGQEVFTAAALAALILGAAVMLTSWIGVSLMVFALTSAE